MMYLYVLSKDNPDIAHAEASAILGSGNLQSNYFFNLQICDHLAYTNCILKILSKGKHLEKTIDNVDWKHTIKGTWALRKLSNGIDIKKIAGKIKTKAKIDLKHPDTDIVVLKINNIYYITKTHWTNPKDYLHRKPHMRPYMHPSSLDPKLAKAMVNMLGIKKGTVVDPFCGSGGILIEAGLMGFSVIGYDIEALSGCEKNLRYYKIKKYRLFRRNALTLDKRHKYIVTDMPYGKNTKNIDKTLYKKFIQNLNVKKAVIGLPETVNYRAIIRNTDYKLKGEFSIYIHKSLKKKIIIISH